MSYRFTRVNLVRSEGFDRPPFDPIVDFGPGLNIITGPNGVGKSTLLRVMRALLHGTPISSAVFADATVATDAQEWELSLAQGELLQRRSESTEFAHLPGRTAELSDSYFFALHELLDRVYDTPIFLEQIKKEMHGGINLQKAAKDSGAKTAFSKANISETKAVETARKAVVALQEKIDKHADIIERIAALEEEIASEEPLRKEIERYRDAVHASEKQEELAEVTQALADFDNRVTQVHPGTEGEYKNLLSRIESAKEELSSHQHIIGAKEKEIASHQLTKNLREDTAWREQLAALIDQLMEREQTKQRCEREHREAHAAYAAAKAEVAWLFAEMPNAEVLQSAVAALTEVASESERVRLQVAVVERLLAALGEGEEVSEAALAEIATELNIVAEALVTQLRATTPSRTRIAVALALILLGGVGSLWWAPLGLTVTVVVSVVLFMLRDKGEAPSLDTQIATLCAREGLSKDATSSVVALYRILTAREAALQQAVEKNKQITRAEAELEKSKEAYQNWRAQHHSAAQALHLRDDHPALERAVFFNFSSSLSLLLQTANTASAKEAAYQHAIAAYNSVSDTLIAHGNLPTEKYHGLLRSARSLQERIGEYENLVQDLARDQQEKTRLEKRLAEVEAERSAFYEKLNLAVGDEQSLWLLIGAVPRYTQSKEEEQAIRRELARVDPAALQLTEEHPKRALKEALAEREAALEAVHASRKELIGLKHTYEDLSHSNELAELDQRWRIRQAELEEHRKEAVQGRVIDALLAEITEESQRKHLPSVVRKASTWFGRITHNRYKLRISDDHFSAEDTVKNRVQQIDELSSGTRIQLLFAVRMGFLEREEERRDGQLPLFFDEILANSDDIRSRAIAEAIAEIATTRQVFYATAQADEVSKLKEVVPDAKVFDLGELSGRQATDERPFAAVTYQVDQVPAAIEDYDHYAEQLAVSAPALFHPIGELHPWYLCTQSTELYDLLNSNFTTAAQAGRSDPRFARRLHLLTLAQRFARQGRPRPLSSAAFIHEAPSEVRRTTQYWQQIIDFLDAEPRTGNDLVAAIEARAIQYLVDPARGALLSWLAEAEYSSEAPPLSVANILTEISFAEETFTVDSVDYAIVHRYLSALRLEK